MNRPLTTRVKIGVLFTSLVCANLLTWLLTWGASHRYALGAQSLLGMGLLAYGFGLRHAVDADHISAIDNTTRKLIQEGQRPVGVGLFFSLGHSTVVVLLCAALALSTAYVQAHLPQWKDTGAFLGTLVSSVFLYLIAVINLVVLWDLFRAYRSAQADTDAAAPQGLLARLLRPLLRLIRHSWQMYFVGFLFGLGFDTATEVGILALSARSGQAHVPLWVVMLLPLLFTVGMCLIDAANGVLMLGAYGWAFVKPARKLYYNLSITLVSVVVAFAVGTNELVGLWGKDLLPKGGVWDALDANLGLVIIAVFAVGWTLSLLISRWRRPEAA